MKTICEICKIPFEENDLIDLRADQFIHLLDKAKKYDDLYNFPDRIGYVYLCEPCYDKHSGTKKEFENFPPSLLKHRFPSIRVFALAHSGKSRCASKDYDSVRVSFICSEDDWDKMKHEFGEKYR